MCCICPFYTSEADIRSLLKDKVGEEEKDILRTIEKTSVMASFNIEGLVSRTLNHYKWASGEFKWYNPFTWLSANRTSRVQNAVNTFVSEFFKEPGLELIPGSSPRSSIDVREQGSVFHTPSSTPPRSPRSREVGQSGGASEGFQAPPSPRSREGSGKSTQFQTPDEPGTPALAGGGTRQPDPKDLLRRLESVVQGKGEAKQPILTEEDEQPFLTPKSEFSPTGSPPSGLIDQAADAFQDRRSRDEIAFTQKATEAVDRRGEPLEEDKFEGGAGEIVGVDDSASIDEKKSPEEIMRREIERIFGFLAPRNDSIGKFLLSKIIPPNPIHFKFDEQTDCFVIRYDREQTGSIPKVVDTKDSWKPAIGTQFSTPLEIHGKFNFAENTIEFKPDQLKAKNGPASIFLLSVKVTPVEENTTNPTTGRRMSKLKYYEFQISGNTKTFFKDYTVSANWTQKEFEDTLQHTSWDVRS